MEQNASTVDINNFLSACKAFGSKNPRLGANCGKFLAKLAVYGFFVERIRKKKLLKEGSFRIQYDDDPNLIVLLKAVAMKTAAFGRVGEFRRMCYKLLGESMASLSYGYGIDIVLDMLKSRKERETALALHNEIMSKGFFAVLHGDQMGTS